MYAIWVKQCIIVLVPEQRYWWEDSQNVTTKSRSYFRSSQVKSNYNFTLSRGARAVPNFNSSLSALCIRLIFFLQGRIKSNQVLTSSPVSIRTLIEGLRERYSGRRARWWTDNAVFFVYYMSPASDFWSWELDRGAYRISPYNFEKTLCEYSETITITMLVVLTRIAVTPADVRCRRISL